MHVYNKRRAPGFDPSTPGSLNLRVSGFARQQVVTVAQVVQAIDVLPGFHLEGLNKIVYAPEFFLFDPYEAYYLGAWGVRRGEFNQRERAVYVGEFQTRAQLHNILFHEIGHFVFFLIISSTVKKQWVTEVSRSADCITAYASRNTSEDFAETYSAFVQDPESLKNLIPAKYEFMRDLVFSGHPSTLKERG